jgi:serine protease Do
MRSTNVKKIMLALAAAWLLGISSCTAYPGSTSQSAPTTGATAAIAQGGGGVDFISVVARVRPGVVAITTETPVRFFGRTFTQEGAGSGWIIDSSGLIVTNNHVIEGARTVTVTMEDGRAFKAVSVKADPDADLAVIRVDARDLPALSVSTNEKLQVGQWVVAVGNALGLGISATKGIVSALNVSVSSSEGSALSGLIQTDAAINPGNSGGPMVNLKGEVVGINSIKISQVGVEGMGYAISIGEAMPIIRNLSK